MKQNEPGMGLTPLLRQKILRLAGTLLVLLQMAANPRQAAAANVANYGADGMDYYQFTTPSMAFDKASGFTTLIPFAMHVNADGTLVIGGNVACTNGVYTGPTNWNSLIATVKTPPTTVTRYEVCIGGWEDTSYADIKSLVNAQGTGPGSILYKNFQALKNAVPEIDAINDDDELTYDLNSSTNFANLLGRLDYKFTMVPYANQSFWVALNNAITNCDYVYVQCYEGGAGNDPGQWQSALGGGVTVIGGQESNTANSTNWRTWFVEDGVAGGFYYPDVVFNSLNWSAAIIAGNGAVAAPPMGVMAMPGGEQVSLSWNTSPGAMSYNVKRSTSSGGETNLASVSTASAWPASNQYIDSKLTDGTTYYYVVSAVNANGESTNSGEVSATPKVSSLSNFGFETPSLGTGNYAYSPAGGSWAFSGASPDGSGLIANGSAFSNPTAVQGVQAAFVQEHGSIRQTLSGLIPGTNYTITFLAAERPGNAQTWNLTVNSAVIASFNPGSGATSYAAYTATFTAAATAETLAFVGTDLPGGDNTIFIDDVQILMSAFSASPQLTTNTSPVTAADVAGSQVTFTAAFASPGPVTYQWRMVSNGLASAIPGATNTTLTLANLQLTNTASYQLQASNAVGTATSIPSSLTVASGPAAVNNVVTTYAAQTGAGSASTNFVPTWTVAPGSLIAGQLPSGTNGNYSLYHAGVAAVLTDGTFGWLNYWPNIGSSPSEVTCGTAGSGAGQPVTYTLAGSPTGYTLTNLVVYGGWGDAGRDQQAYTVYYSKISAPTTFIALDTVNYLPANPAGVQCATRATLTPVNGVLATNVAAVKLDFTTPAGENGYEGYSEIEVFGAPTPQPVKWAVGNGNWDTTTSNWEPLAGGAALSYVENNLAAFDDSAAGASPLTVTLTGNHWPTVVTNNSAKNYILAGNYALTGGSLIKDGSGTLLLDNGGVNGFTSVLINHGTVQVGNRDTNGSLGTGRVTNNGALVFDRTDALTVANLISGSGSLAQHGPGALALTAANTYAGNTTITAGTLALAGTGAIGASALIMVSSDTLLDVTGRPDQTLTLNAGQTLTGSGSINGNVAALAGSTLNPGDTIGTLSVLDNVTLAGGLVMELNRTNTQTSDQLVSILGAITVTGTLTVTNLGPALQAGDRFTLFNQPVSGFATVSLPPVGGNGWANNLANNGTVAVVSTAPPTVLAQVGAGVITLTWPADHAGWQLLAQTNPSAQGLGTNWFNVTGSTGTNQLAIPINPTNGSVFYRLILQE
jgi:autotransporter-associated beta strand protein